MLCKIVLLIRYLLLLLLLLLLKKMPNAKNLKFFKINVLIQTRLFQPNASYTSHETNKDTGPCQVTIVHWLK